MAKRISFDAEVIFDHHQGRLRIQTSVREPEGALWQPVRVPAKEEVPYRQYTRSLLINTGYRAAWGPDELMELGAVGHLRDGLFEQRTRLKDLGITFVRKSNTGKTALEYQSSSGVSTAFKVAGESSAAFQGVGSASAGVRFDFSRSGAVVFSVPNYVISEIDDKRSLEKRLRSASEWEIDWAIVTKVLNAKSATILVSGSSSAFAELRAKADIGPEGVELADLAGGFTRARTSGMAVHFVAEGHLTPLYETFRMYQPPLTRDHGKRKLVHV